MSAISGKYPTCCLICLNASAALSVGTDTRTRSAPALAQALICATVAATSSVSVLVMVCTAIGAPPPMGTRPTRIWRETRRWIVCWDFIGATCPLRNGEAGRVVLGVDVGGEIHRLAVEEHPHVLGVAQEHRVR